MEEKAERVGGIYDSENSKKQAGSVYETDGLSPTLSTCEGGNRMPLLVGGVGEKDSNGGRQYYQQNRIYSDESVSLCQSASPQFNPWYTQGVRIRKLTPREAWRLMGFKDEDFDKAKEAVSDSQLYRQAGNSIVVDTLCDLFSQLL